ncbi:matrixin family metalloprotease [Microbacterium sp.]|uniref:matrixin family metalloprotease n=1 Tax=Microbacterium sp. TaxID=51671 RepID=UPI0028126BA7|nr:matrixin family metalloprotease [Microbacterium sp.]
MKRILTLAAIATLAVVGIPSVAAAHGDRGCPAPAAQQSAVSAAVADGLDTRSCDAVTTVREDGVGVEIPEAGYGVVAIAIGDDGTETALTVTTSPDGVVDVETQEHAATGDEGVETEGHAATTSATTTATVNRCSDTSHALLGGKWFSTPTFMVNSTERRPSNISEANWEIVVGDALRTITTGADGCSLSPTPSATGVTRMNQLGDANISSTNTCTSTDSVSVVDFGSLSGTPLALTCVSFVFGTDQIRAADLRIDNSNVSWVTSVSGCTGTKYDLRSTLTHEFGHAFGLGHAVERGGNDLTMSPSVTACNSSARYLGLGDLRGLLALYPN